MGYISEVDSGVRDSRVELKGGVNNIVERNDVTELFAGELEKILGP